ncbi:MAG: methyltransferase regulatory domain-containing protein [Novosphingobium sp.]
MDALTSEFAQLQDSIDRVSAQYDELPYSSRPFAKSHPARLAATAQLFGLKAPPVEKARVLELGCASGGNLIPHAAFFPDAQFVGVDLGKRQVEDGRGRIERLGLRNIELHCMSLTDIDERFGQFDYIISHGVYSWVPAPVRDALLKVTRERLSTEGIAYVSYNVLPGWRLNQPLRDAFRLLIPDSHSPLDRVRMVRSLLEFFRDNAVDNSPFGAMLRNAPERLAGLPDDYVFHEYMEEANEPVAFSQFAEHAKANGLTFLAESELQTMFADNYRPGLADAIRSRTTGDLVTSEQLIDFLTGRAFRQTLLVASEHAGEIGSVLSPERMEGLHFLASAGMKLEVGNGATRLTDARGRTMQSKEPAVGRAMQVMLARHPESTTLDQCADNMAPPQRHAVADALMRMVMAGILDISSVPLPAGRAGARPRATALARDDAATERDVTTNRRHEMVQIDPAACALLPHLDGKTDRKALAELLAEAAVAGTLRFQRNGRVESDPERLRAVARELLPKVLDSIARSGLLEP